MAASSAVKTFGLVTALISLALSIGALIVSLIDYRIINIDWNNSPWRHLGVLQLISTCYAVFGILTYIVFSQDKTIILFVNFYIILYSI